MISVIKYNAGNIGSITNALKRLNADVIVTDDPKLIQKADKVILPGVGEAKSAMNSLKSCGLDTIIPKLKQPFLGVCLGLQLLCDYSDEGNTKCLGVIQEQVHKFPPLGKIPHMGWDDFTDIRGSLFEGIDPQDDMYYVHSYYATTGANTIGTCNYLINFSAALQRDNFFAVQFHPEKSAQVGSRMLKNFLSL